MDLNGSNSKVKKETGTTENIFQKIMGMFFSGSDSDKDKKRLLKNIAKQLNRQKYNFYNPKSGEIQVSFAKFFHEIYKITGPGKILLENALASGVLKTIVIEGFLSDEQKKVGEAFSEEIIREKAANTDPKALATELKNSLVNYFSIFNSDLTKEINSAYSNLTSFLNFINFDYFFLLKKFDSGIPEQNFSYNPRFDSINGEYISDDLKDFFELINDISSNYPWEQLFKILAEYKGSEIINSGSWNKILKGLDNTKKTGVFGLIIKHIDKDPAFKSAFYPSNERIVEDYLAKLKTQIEMNVQKVQREKQTKKIDGLLKLIFGTTAVSRTKNYTEKANLMFAKQMLGGFIYTAPMNYLKAFYLDFFKKDIKELIDLLLIKGKWSTNIMSQQLSESFHALMKLSTDLLEFDEDLSEEGEMGIILRNSIKRSSKDKNSMGILRKQITDINASALNILQQSAQNFIIMGKSLKKVHDDYDKKPAEFIINWKELGSVSQNPIKESITEIYKQSYYFIQLLQFYLKKSSKSG